jgi:hypothetical protein
VHLLWPEVIGTVRGRYFILTRQELDSQTAKEWGAVNEIVPAEKLLARAREIAEELAKLPPLTTRYTRIALTQKLRRIIDEGVGYGLALEGISAADVARANGGPVVPGNSRANEWESMSLLLSQHCRRRRGSSREELKYASICAFEG